MIAVKLLRDVLAVALLATLCLLSPGPAQAAQEIVNVGGQTHVVDGTNVRRLANQLIKYTPAAGARTGTNPYGFEAAVVDGRVTKIANGVGNMAIPSNGFVLSGHGEARTWLMANAKVGTSVTSDATPPPPPPPAGNYVVIDSSSYQISGTNRVRRADELILYTPANGPTTGTNAYGFEVSVVDGKVVSRSSAGSMTIPSNGYVLSGHGLAKIWLMSHAVTGETVNLTNDPPPSTVRKLLPDVGVRTLRAFAIVNDGGRKLLKFPAVTANVGDGPMEIVGTRPSSTSSDWSSRQIIHRSDGSTVSQPGTATFYWAGDGHSHWHIRDFDNYELWNDSGTVLRRGEKHGFCFEDNTSYRNWVGSPSHPEVPTSPVYTHEDSCGEADPSATSIVHGLSVGWADTYPASLPDQAIDVTGLADGTYVVKVTADWQHFWDETNELNNSASARIRITGNQVTLLSADDGL